MNLYSSILVQLGAFWMLVAAIGFYRLAGFLPKVHALTKGTSFGIILLLLGAALQISTFEGWLLALLCIGMVFITTPLSAYLLADSAAADDENDEI